MHPQGTRASLKRPINLEPQAFSSIITRVAARRRRRPYQGAGVLHGCRVLGGARRADERVIRCFTIQRVDGAQARGPPSRIERGVLANFVAARADDRRPRGASLVIIWRGRAPPPPRTLICRARPRVLTHYHHLSSARRRTELR